MLNHLLGEPYVDFGNISISLESTHLNRKEGRYVYICIRDAFRRPNKVSVYSPATKEQIINCLESNIESFEHALLDDIYHNANFEQDWEVSTEFEELTLNQKLEILKLTDYLNDRNVIKLFLMDVEYWNRLIVKK